MEISLTKVLAALALGLGCRAGCNALVNDTKKLGENLGNKIVQQGKDVERLGTNGKLPPKQTLYHQIKDRR